MSHYYSEEQDSKLRLFEIEVNALGRTFTIYSASGVFASKKLDRGTELLINSMQVQDGMRVLDLGCGCGAVGVCVASAYRADLVMADINKRAVKVARMNLKKLNLNAEVVQSNLYENIEGVFDAILLNPPQTAGKDVCFAMIEGARERLKKGGSLQLVARHRKGGKQLSEKMQEVFGKVEVLDRKGGFRVYKSIRLQ